MARGSAEGRVHWRYRILIAFAALLFAAVGVRYMALLAGPLPAEESEKPLMLPERGEIVDRKGDILAIQTTQYNLSAWKPSVADPEAASAELAEALGADSAAILALLKAGGSNYAYIKKGLSPQESERVRSALALGRLRGISLEPIPGRSYPEGEVFAHIVGLVGTEGKGLAGIELSYDEDLRPRTRTQAGLEGNRIVLSLDSQVQYLLHRLSKKAMEDNKADAVMFIAMDGKTGEVLGYVSLPGFDPNSIGGASPSSLLDRPSLYLYEPGSVFKVFSMAGLTQLGALGEDSVFRCDGTYVKETSSGEKITITCLAPHGDVTPSLILEYSCNVGAAYASDIVSQRDFYDSIRAFGFGERTGISLPGEAAGILRPVERWSLRSKPTLAFGQELSATAIQMATAATVISSGGYLLRPRIVNQVLSPAGKVLFQAKTEPVRRVVSAETARKVLGYMESTAIRTASVGGGTGTDLRLAGKSGTAQKADPRTGKYSESAYMATYLALLPADDPALILYMAIDTPRGPSIYGGKIAAPIVREAADELATLLGIRRETEILATHPGVTSIPKPGPIVIADLMPDLTGKPKKLLLPLLARKDLKVRILGEGYVARQSPAPGSPIAAGTEIVLELE